MDIDARMTLGSYLRQCRLSTLCAPKNKPMSQDMLAHLLTEKGPPATQGLVWAWEFDKTVPKADALSAIAEILPTCDLETLRDLAADAETRLRREREEKKSA